MTYSHHNIYHILQKLLISGNNEPFASTFNVTVILTVTS